VKVLTKAETRLIIFINGKDQEQIAKYVFGAALISLMISLGMCLREIQISTRALSIQLKDIGEEVQLWDPIKKLVKKRVIS
jgi:hypothetical protein